MYEQKERQIPYVYKVLEEYGLKIEKSKKGDKDEKKNNRFGRNFN